VLVEATIEARDNDVVSGPKWGRSEVVAIVPPSLGEEEALRMEALRGLRDELVDLLALRLGTQVPLSQAERAALVAREAGAHRVLQQSVLDVMARQFGSLQLLTWMGCGT